MREAVVYKSENLLSYEHSPKVRSKRRSNLVNSAFFFSQSPKRKMLATFALSLLIFTRTALASSSDGEWMDLRDLSRLLEAAKKTTTNTPDYEPQCRAADIGLIIDSSASIYEPDYNKGLTFLANFLDKFDIGKGTDQDRVAAVSFGDRVYSTDGFNFNTYDNKEAVKAHVLGMPFKAGNSTQTGDALKYMRELQVEMGRSWTRQIQLVLTDGESSSRTKTTIQAGLTKEANITVVAVGVGTAVNREELIIIAGGVEENAHRARSYDHLDIKLIERILLRLCKPCGLKFPADINFVFSAATMGLTQTSKVTSFISNVIRHEELNEGFQYGVVSGDCPDDEGFRLNQYNSPGPIRDHLERYNRNNLPYIVQRATDTRFTPESGARLNATQTAVIFLGKNKVNRRKLARVIKGMLASNVRVFVSYKKLPKNLARLLPEEVTFLFGNAASQVTQLVNHLCHDARNLK